MGILQGKEAIPLAILIAKNYFIIIVQDFGLLHNPFSLR